MTETPETLTVALTGIYAMLMPPGVRVEGRRSAPEMGLEGTLRGLLAIDKGRGSLRCARVFASAEAWGQSTFTRALPKGKFQIKFAMVLAEDPLSRQIAPQGLMGVGTEAYLDPECP